MIFSSLQKKGEVTSHESSENQIAPYLFLLMGIRHGYVLGLATGLIPTCSHNLYHFVSGKKEDATYFNFLYFYQQESSLTLMWDSFHY